MTKKPRHSDRDEDQAQSQRFIELARDLEVKGELDPDEDGRSLERLVRRSITPKTAD
jgi:hypothetical protein